MKDFKDLKVWGKSHNLTLKIYQITQDFPKEERYGLTSQLRRAAVSIPTNIAEGCGRNTDPELARFLEIAFASANEVEYLLILANTLKYLLDSKYHTIINDISEVKRMLSAFILKLRADR